MPTSSTRSKDNAAAATDRYNGIADVSGVSPAVIDAFSRRRAEIDAQVADWGRTSATARQSAALATRARKDYDVTPQTLAAEWRGRACSLGLDDRATEGLLDRGASRELPSAEIAARLVSANIVLFCRDIVAAPRVGFEPTTCGLEVRCSIH